MDLGLHSELFVTVRPVAVTLISLSHCGMVLVDLSQDLPAEQCHRSPLAACLRSIDWLILNLFNMGPF